MSSQRPEWFSALYAALGRPGTVHVRVDAGRVGGLSYGHLERCRILSALLRQEGATTRFFMRPLPDGVARARECGETVHLVEPVEADGTPWLTMFAQADALVVDLPYDPEPELVALCAQSAGGARRVGCIDDFGRDLLACDVVLNYSVLADPAAYPRAGRVLLGPEYLMMDAAFQALAAGAANRSNALVVTLGGSDPTDLTRRILPRLLAHDLHGLQVLAVLGPGFGEGDDLLALAERSGGRLAVCRAPEALLPLLADSAGVICSGGKTLYECLALGKPVVAVGSTAREAEVIAAFEGRGDLVGGLACWNEQEFSESISRLVRMVTDD